MKRRNRPQSLIGMPISSQSASRLGSMSVSAFLPEHGDLIRDYFDGLRFVHAAVERPPGRDAYDVVVTFERPAQKLRCSIAEDALDSIRQARQARLRRSDARRVAAWAERAPDLTDYLIGYRAWHVDEQGALQPFGRWYSATAAGPGGWDGPRKVTALCDRHGDHLAPEPDCHCGFNTYRFPPSYDPYALPLIDYSKQPMRVVSFALQDQYTVGWKVDALHTDEVVAGAVRGWGRVEAHMDGWRSEHAQPVVLCANELIEIDSRRVPDPDVHPAAARVAQRYPEIPWVRWDELRTAAREHGQEFGQQLLPEPESFTDAYQRETAGLRALVKKPSPSGVINNLTG